MKRIDPKAIFKLVLALGDVGIVAGGFLCAYWLRFHLPFFPPPPEADFGSYTRFSVLIFGTDWFCLFSHTVFGGYVSISAAFFRH